MSESDLRLLIVDDDPDDVLLFRDCMREGPWDGALQVEDASTPARAMELLAGGHYDAIFIDYRLGPESGLDLLRTIRSKGLDSPVIILTGHGDEQVAVEALKTGATDYVLKSHLSASVIGSAIRHGLELSRKEAQRREAEVALRESEELYRLLVQNVDDIIYKVMIDAGDAMQGKVQFVSGQVKRILGYDAEEFVTNPLLWSQILHPDDVANVAEVTRRILKDSTTCTRQYRIRQLTGKYIWIEDKVTTLFNPNGRAVSLLGVACNVTERRNLEDQLRQAQKMEAVGQLAGGIAHDFNNILTAIIGYGTFLQMKLKDGDPLKHSADQILASAERAAHLTQSLLAFSRKQIINPKPVDLNEIIRALVRFLKRIIGEDIELRTVPAEGELIVKADSGQIEQILMNLATNARDAMPKGGLITVSTSRLSLDAEFTKAHGYGEPGPYALISFEDTGVGIDKKTQEKIFDPFFTTKEVGKGTGLGLSIVYGIVKQHNGYVTVYSEQGMGTTFRIYFPITRSAIEEARQREEAAPASGSETVLLGEDDPGVRNLTKMILEQSGYTVIEALDGDEAVAKFMENRDRIQLLLLDIVMPKKSGKAVSEEIRKTSPRVRVLFTSGYTAEIIHQNGILDEGLNFITKPFSPRDLLKKIREVLDQ